jgi:hypothetical protein
MASYRRVMFEPAFSSPAAADAPQGSLRRLDWDEIVARLAATRDLRALLARPVVQGGGFVPQTAAGIAGTIAGERGVNFAALATGKCTDTTIAAVARQAGHGDRDK